MTSQLYEGKHKNIDWKGTYITKINEILAEKEAQGMKSSIRGMFYILVSRFPNDIPNTRSIYSSYDSATVKARKGQNGYPHMDEDAFVDNIRKIIDIDDEFITGEEQAEYLIQKLKDAGNNYSIPRWHKQPRYVEVWLEKDAVVSLFRNILRDGEQDKEVRIVPNRGWTSQTFVKKNINRLWRKLVSEEPKEIYVLYFGDFDPTGNRMFVIIKSEIEESLKKILWNAILKDKDIKEKNRQEVFEFFRKRIHVERVSITESQITEFSLEHLTNPLPEVEKKLEGYEEHTIVKKGRVMIVPAKKGDPNTKWFKRHFGQGKVFQIELDAMEARYDQFKELLLTSVDSKFDKSIFEIQVQQRLKTEREIVTQYLNEKVEFR